MKHRLYEKWWGGIRSVMVQMPTGTGKTYLMAAVVRENAADGVLVVTHRIELVEQISETLSRFGVRHGVIAGGRKALLAENVRVASIQTLSRCIDSLSFCPSVVVVDEAHHALAKTYRILWEKVAGGSFLGTDGYALPVERRTFHGLVRGIAPNVEYGTLYRRGVVG